MREESVAAFKAQAPVAVSKEGAPNGQADNLSTMVDKPAALRSIRDIIADLSKPIPERHLKSRVQGGKALHYIDWSTAVRFLDHYAPGWSCEVRNVTISDARCVVTMRISVPCAEGVVSREATGTEDEELKGYGDPSSNAEAMALKRAAAKFGLGLYLYQK